MKDFINYFNRTSQETDKNVFPTPSFVKDSNSLSFITSYAGSTFNNGLYRLHNKTSSELGQKNANRLFPQLRRKATVFGYDWLGRQYAFHNRNKNKIFLLDVSTANYYTMNSNFTDFHNFILIEYIEASLEKETFEEYQKHNPADIPLAFNEAISYKHPLFLGGSEEISNMEKTDMDVYWSISSQFYT